jgi:type III secretion protein C
MSLVLGGRNNFIARISALQNNGVARVVSSPQVMTLSNVEALFDTTRSFYVRVAGRDDVDLFQVTAGTALKVTPHVFTDRDNQIQIKLLVQIEDGRFADTRVDTLPVVERSSINTQALIMGGESLLIGGLVREASSEGVTKVPFLGDIPIVGNLFKTTNTGGERVERLFLISPRIVPARRALASNQGPRKPGDAVPTPPMPPMLQQPSGSQQPAAPEPSPPSVMPRSGESA